MYFWLFSDSERTSSSSAEKPSRMYLPSLMLPVPFSFIARSRRSKTGPCVESWLFSFFKSTEPAPERSCFTCGTARSVALRESRSLGEVEFASIRERIRSKSKTPESISSRRESSVMCCVSSSIADWRSMMRFTSVSGRSRERFKRRAPIAVCV